MNQQKKVSGLYGLLEEHLCETKHALYISLMLKCNLGILQ